MQQPDTAGTEYVALGRIIGVYGVKGWVKVHSDTDPRENIVNYNHWWLQQAGHWQRIEVVQGRRQSKTVVAQLQGIIDRQQAAELIGADIAVLRSALPTLAADEYYWTDLIGAEVVSLDGTRLGRAERLFETGANDVLVVCDEGQQNAGAASEILIPWIRPDVITQVDLDQRRITVDWDPEF